MIKKYIFLVLLFPSILFAQEEKYPVFDACKGSEIESIKDCFYATTKKHFFGEFKTPPVVENENFTGVVNTIFAITKEGDFKLIYVNTPYQEIKNEVIRAFKVFPKIAPAKYNNHAIEMKFELPIQFPIVKNKKIITTITKEEKKRKFSRGCETE